MHRAGPAALAAAQGSAAGSRGPCPPSATLTVAAQQPAAARTLPARNTRPCISFTVRCSSDPVQLSRDQGVALARKLRRAGKTGPVGTGAAGLVLVSVVATDTGCEQRVALKQGGLPVTVGIDAPVADQRVQETSNSEIPHSAATRHRLPHRQQWVRRALLTSSPATTAHSETPITCLPSAPGSKKIQRTPASIRCRALTNDPVGMRSGAKLAKPIPGTPE